MLQHAWCLERPCVNQQPVERIATQEWGNLQIVVTRTLVGQLFQDDEVGYCKKLC